MMNKKCLKISVYGFFSTLPFLLLSNMAQARGGYGGWGMGPGMMGGWSMGWWGFIPMLLFWGLIIAGVVLLIKVLARGGSRKGSGKKLTHFNAESTEGRFIKSESHNCKYSLLHKN